MFDIGDYVIYGMKGVCRIEAIGCLSSIRGMSEGLYYTMKQVYTRNSRIFTPVDNDRVIIRKLISKQEAEMLISDIPNIKSMWIPDEKNREEQYKERLKTCDCYNVLMIIKTVYERKEIRVAAGKKMTAKDERYLQMAENALYGELAIVFDKDKEDVLRTVRQKLNDSICQYT